MKQWLRLRTSPLWLTVAILLGAGVITYVALDLCYSIRRSTALSAARTHSMTLTAIRDELSKTIAPQQPFNPHQLDRDPKRLPVAYTILSNVSDNNDFPEDGSFRIFSRFPWPNRKNGGPRTALERELTYHIVDLGSAEEIREEERDGERILVYASPIIMRKRCLACHNTHPSSPKRGWREGDVRGIQTIEIRLSSIPMLPSQSSLNSAVSLSAIGFGLLFACALLIRKMASISAHSERMAVLSSAAEAVGDGIITIDAEGRVLSFNRAAESIFGYARGEVIGQPSMILMGQEDAKRHEAGFRKLFATREPKGPIGPVKVRARTRSGEWIPVSMIVSLVPDCEPPRIVGSVRDLREVEKQEEQLREAQRLKDVGQLTSGVAHDFNNLLQVIGANATLLRGTVQDPEAIRLADDIESTVEHASALTYSLLAFAGRRTVAAAPRDIAPDIRDTVRLLDHAPSAGTAIDLRIEELLWHVETDPAMLQSAIINIVFNAFDAMPEGGMLKIDACNKSGSVSSPVSDSPSEKDYVALSFLDEGVGIPASELDKVFEPFYSKKKKGAARGLGLSMIRKFMHESGGEIEIESQVGEWTRVTILLPRATGGSSKSQPEQRQPEHSRGTDVAVEGIPLEQCRVLLVDDDLMVGKALLGLLKSHGAQCALVDGGEKALTHLEGGDPVDVIITDIVMPKMNGIDLAKTVQDRYPKLPIILLSGNISRFEMEVPPRAHLMQKPVKLPQLLERIREMIGRTGNTAQR